MTDFPTHFKPGTEAHDVLSKYVHWLNLWTATEPTFEPITIEDFFKYEGTTFVIHQEQEPDSSRSTLMIQAYYGDDGGAAHLTAVYSRDIWSEDNDWELSCIVQEFDTQYQIIWTDGRFQNGPRSSVDIRVFWKHNDSASTTALAELLYADLDQTIDKYVIEGCDPDSWDAYCRMAAILFGNLHLVHSLGVQEVDHLIQRINQFGRYRGFARQFSDYIQ